MDTINPVKSLNFTIKGGENPSVGNVFDYLNTAPYNEIWFLKKMMMKESHVWEENNLVSEMGQFNAYYQNSENLPSNWDAHSRCPYLTNDCGWGLAQLTNPVPHSQVLWDWKANVQGAYHLLMEDKRGLVLTSRNDGLVASATAINDWNNRPINQNDQVEPYELDYGGITWRTGPSNLFNNNPLIDGVFDAKLAQDERSLLDACLIMAYNGYGGTEYNFIYINRDGNNKPFWFLKTTKIIT